MHKLDRWTLTASAGLVILALMACKKKEEEAPPAESAQPAPEPTPAASASAEPAKDEVKRYGDKEQDESGTVRVIFANAKVFNEADDSTPHISTLSLGTLVNRKARYGNWMLVDWPSGPGELSPGWIMTKYLDIKILKFTIDDIKKQDAAVAVVTVPDAAATATATPDAAPTTTVAATPDAATTTTKPRLKVPIDKIKEALDKSKKQ
jgi:hypothetical protein